MGLYKNNNGTLELISGATLYADNPIGSILPYGGATAPLGWLLCQGQAVSRTDYADLFSVIGTAFGNGDGTTTFNLPDLREATTKGAGLTGLSNNHIDSNGLILGEFIDDQLQDHVHSIGVRTSNGGTSGPGWHYLNTPIDSTYDSQGITSSYRKGATTEVKAVGVNYIIKAKQVAAPADFTGAAEAAGTAAAEEVVAQKVTKFSGTDSGNTYVTVDQLAYDQTNNALGLKVNGADTVIPFKHGNNFSPDAESQKVIMFASETQRMISQDGYRSIMSVDQDYFEVISTKIEPNTYRITEMVIKAKKNFSIRMLGGFYNGSFAFLPLYNTSSALTYLNHVWSITEGTSYTWRNYETNTQDNASATCYAVLVSE